VHTRYQGMGIGSVMLANARAAAEAIGGPHLAWRLGAEPPGDPLLRAPFLLVDARL
jgi:hypothetical protein